MERIHGFGWDPAGKRQFVCATRTWEDNIGMDFYREWNGVDCKPDK